jgi:glycosyltransferase involved in cell wall biosynthesis
VKSFDPQVVLTVVDGFLWKSACEVAHALRVPLVQLVHDDWPSMMIDMTQYRRGPIMRILHSFYQNVFRREYQGAAKRLCICPGMAQHYEKDYGIKGEVLYPNRGEDSPTPTVRVANSSEREPVIAFAGTLHTRGAILLLRALAELLLPMKGRLELYVGDYVNLAQIDLNLPNVRKAGFWPPAELAAKLAESAHALFLPSSFLPEEQTIVLTLFPSKLVDYTAIGLPIIIWGPASSSAARWGLENPSAALTFTTEEPGPIREAIHRLAREPEYAVSLAEGALGAGNRDFDLHQARSTLQRHLLNVVAPGSGRSRR